MIQELLAINARRRELLERELEIEIARLRHRHRQRVGDLYSEVIAAINDQYDSVRRGLEKMAEMDGTEFLSAVLDSPDPDILAALADRKESAIDKDKADRYLEKLAREGLWEHRPVRRPQHRGSASTDVVARTSVAEQLKILLPKIGEPGATFDSSEARRVFVSRHGDISRRGLSARLGQALRKLADDGVLELVEATGDVKRPNTYRIPEQGSKPVGSVARPPKGEERHG